MGETETLSICETVSKNGYIWRFLIEWDADHDLRIVAVVNHMIWTGDLERLDVTTIGESKGCLRIWSFAGAGHFYSHYDVDGDLWNVIVHDEEDVVARKLGAGATLWVDVVGGAQ